MKKIPTIFVRDPANPKFVTREVNPECQWVIDGEGVATRKWDGSACLIRGGKLFKRVEWPEEKGSAPASWLHHSFDESIRHGHGWLPVGDGTEDWIHRLADTYGLADGTHELVAPKVNKNPEGVSAPTLVRHGALHFTVEDRTFDGLVNFLNGYIMEGLVFHHADGRMAKIKSRDLGIAWPRKSGGGA